MPTLHSSLGASGSKRWLNCPASIRLSIGRPPSPTNKFAAEGTVAHKVGETALIDGKDAAHYIGLYGDGDIDCELYTDPTGAEFEFKVTAEMARAVQVYLDAINEKMEELRFAGHNPILLVEKSFNLNFIQDGMFGTNDACIWVPGVYLGIYDYKHGRGVAVEVEDNSQLNYYGLGALRELCWRDDDYEPKKMSGYYDLPETVELVVLQPRARHINGPVRRWETTANYLVCDFAEKLRAGALETLKPDSVIEAGEWCRWCPAEAVCPKLEQKAQDEMRVSFGDLDVEDLSTPRKAKAAGKTLGTQQALERTPEELGRIIAALPLIEGWAATLKAHAQTVLENGGEVNGFKLVEGRTRRKWKGEASVIEALSLIMDEETFMDRKLKSFTELENVPGMENMIKALTERPEPGLTIAPDSDKRPATSKSTNNAGFNTDEL